MYSMRSSSEEESSVSELEEGNHVGVVWPKIASGVWRLGHVFDGKLYFARDLWEEKWVPEDLAPLEKSVPAPKVRAKPEEESPKQAGQLAQAAAKAAAERAPRSIAIISPCHTLSPCCANQTCPTIQSVLSSYLLYTIPLDATQELQQHWCCINAKVYTLMSCSLTLVLMKLSSKSCAP